VLNKPYLALDASDNVYLTDPENHRVLKYTNDGKLLAVLGKPGTDLSSFNLPTGIAVDALGGVVVVDSGNNRVLRFDALSK
jgi:DNA-binding beta-propeller fold protein YncE